MRILIWHEDTRGPGEGGGAESLLRDLTMALKAMDHTVAWLHSPQIAQAVDTFKPDIVMVGTIFNKMGFESVKWLQESRVPHIWAMMDYYPFCGGRMLLRNWDESCTAVKGVCDDNCKEGRAPVEWLEIVNRSPVLAYNQYTAEIYRRNGLRCDYVCELGVDTELFKPDQTKKESSSIYTSSAWPEYPAKGMKYLNQALQGTPFTVHLMTRLTREQVAIGLKRADIFVFPSTYEETWGLCLNEALASGCAVIASDVAGARAQVHEGMGLLVPPRDPESIQDAIYSLSHDPMKRRLMGQVACEHNQVEHTLDAMGSRFIAAFESEVKRER
jgi:hypothetical protein